MESPSWIDKEVWEAFVEMRRAKGKRAPFTDRAAKMLIGELDRLRGQGHNPDEVLKQSVINGWSGVFPLKHLETFGRPAFQQPANHPDPVMATQSYLKAREEYVPTRSEEVRAKLMAARQAVKGAKA